MVATPTPVQSRLDNLETILEPQRFELLNHPIYSKIDSRESLQIFTQFHVFAVWDFMSLLKSLQRQLTCVEIPWVPSENLTGRRLINEIVLGEESDEDGQGGFCSHFELYLSSMQQLGADPYLIERFLENLKNGRDVTNAMAESDLPRAVVQFIRQTFDLIDTGTLPAIAAGFTFGREDLLPDVFQKIVEKINNQFEGKASQFVYYLQRHIELDGDHHGPMAHQLLAYLCGDDDEKWQQAEDAARRSLEARKLLWDGMLEAIS